ncbi:RsmE family RNA methyltransferase [Haloferula sp. A504]|uniref:RsmE family RNA methyltransferase n=1 Tax=Haloferula sp. A504 TaxID=3373601 RepID=UPI0031C53FD1|nr:16S rRNA (uracil(1498)-N(3))-methyltransferase [Verrucomicrobiaceae bacterium E54]
MPRFLLEPERWGREASLTGAEAHHCARVMRAAPGDRVEVFDGAGRGAEATIVSVSKQEVRLTISGERWEAEPAVRVVLAIAALKGKAMDWTIQKAVELGVDEIVPVLSERSIARGEGGKWSRTALEACKQCGRWRLPPVGPTERLEEFLGRQSSGENRRILASLGADSVPLRAALEEAPRPAEAVFLVGPEGDFSDSETRAAIEAGFVAASLGTTVLRSETAAIHCLSAARYAFA